ncbi:MAG: hypothetical protein ACK2TW_04350 [Anaerolineales bacterium]
MESVTEETESKHKRYRINTSPATDLVQRPSRFIVRVGKIGLALHLFKSLIKNRINLKVVTSRPCIYGVYSGPVGGFSPRPALCVGCLRCTTEYPGFVQILPNPERNAWGDGFFTAQQHETILYEAETGRIPVRGAGYRGRFGGNGWDGIWTDMSEIVRPTRDGIHGREYISTRVDIGAKPAFLRFDHTGRPLEKDFNFFSIQVPFFFDLGKKIPLPDGLTRAISKAAKELDTLLVIPLETAANLGLNGNWIVPIITKDNLHSLNKIPPDARMVETSGLDQAQVNRVKEVLPDCLLCLRIPFPNSQETKPIPSDGINVYHFSLDPLRSGHGDQNPFDLIQSFHHHFVEMRQRDQVTLLGSGGICAAEHVPKAIIAGLDAVGIDTALLAALQGRPPDDPADGSTENWIFPLDPPLDWALQRILNLSASWRDQLLEVLGAMGLREVRRLRGETGRMMMQVELEREAFAGIEGYHG